MKKIHQCSILIALIIIGAFIFLNRILNTPEMNISTEFQVPNMDIIAHPDKYTYMIKHDSISNQKPKNLTMIVFNDTWKEIRPFSFVHSSYADDSKGKLGYTVVKVVSLLPQTQLTNLKLFCKARKNDSTPEIRGSTAAVTPLPEQRQKEYLSVFMICFFRGISPPLEVTLVEGQDKPSTHWMPVNSFPIPAENYSISVCVRPIFDEGNDVAQIAEFLAFYNSVGVTKFTFYDYDMTKASKEYLKSVVDEDISIQLVDWKLPDYVSLSTWQYAQMASIQDCVLRNRDSAFALIVDLDEFLVPRHHYTLTELLQELSEKSHRKIGSYIFRSSYFCKPENVSKNESTMKVSSWLSRESKIWHSRKRSKTIVRTNAVEECGIHYVWKHKDGWKSGRVPWQLAMIHHYREDGCTRNNNSTIEDRSAESFKMDMLFSKPMKKLRELLKS